jgi:hypothetical protein
MPPLSMMPTIQTLKIYHISFTYGRIYLLAFPKNSKHKLALSLPHHMDRTAMPCQYSLFLQNFTFCCILKLTVQNVITSVKETFSVIYIICVWWLFKTVTLLSRKDFLICFYIGCVTVTGNVPRLGFQSDSIVLLYLQMEICELLKFRHIL